MQSGRTIAELVGKLSELAPQISDENLSKAFHRPEPGARPSCCFFNVMDKVKKDGGKLIYGWQFLYKCNSQFGDYIMATHHAVWLNPRGYLVDVTPFEVDPNHHPLGDNGNVVIFLPDLSAEPVQREKLMAPLPSKFFAVDDNQQIQNYVEQLNEDEIEKCEKIYSGDFDKERIMGAVEIEKPDA